MHGPINVKSLNNTSKWQMGFNSAFKGLIDLRLAPSPLWNVTRTRLVDGYLRFEITFRYPNPFDLTQCDYWSPGKSGNNVYKNNTCTDNALNL
jgi:hypothetical protein